MIKLNPDKEFVKNFKEKLKENQGFCPCRIIKNVDTKCMCKEFREQVFSNVEGWCHCGLYYNKKEEN